MVGYDPDLRFIEGYSSVNDAKKRLQLEDEDSGTALFHIREFFEWKLPAFQNTFQ